MAGILISHPLMPIECGARTWVLALPLCQQSARFHFTAFSIRSFKATLIGRFGAVKVAPSSTFDLKCAAGGVLLFCRTVFPAKEM